VLPNTDFVARLCLNSTLDQTTRIPTVASFGFRYDDQNGWVDTYLSCDWLEHLPDSGGTHPEKLAALRTYQLTNPYEVQLIKPTYMMVYAVMSVAVVHAAHLDEAGPTTLECLHKPRNGIEADPHAGIQPNPGVPRWTAGVDDPAYLAVRQYLFLNCCHHEPAAAKPQ
jgi:hypothetical protein